MSDSQALKNFISLGPNCCIRLRLDHYLQLYGMKCDKTNLFDWNLINTNTLRQFLSSKIDIQQYFNKNNLTTGKIGNKLYVELKDVYFRSIHDIAPNLKTHILDKALDEYVKKCVRRHVRLINRIHSNDPIVFVYMDDIPQECYQHIQENVRIASGGVNRIFVCLSDYGPDQCMLTNSEGLHRVNYHNLYNVNNDNIIEFLRTTNWLYMEFLNWDKIFDILFDIYKTNF